MADGPSRSVVALPSTAHARVQARSVRVLVLVVLLAAASVSQAAAQLRVVPYATGFVAPLAFVQDPSDPTVQVVVEQRGLVWALKNGVRQATPFIDLSTETAASGERGLLGLAFAPNDATSGRVFVNFTNLSGHTVIARFRRSPNNPLVTDPTSRFDLRWASDGGQRFITQPFANHNGGNVVFGPDGYLYLGMGDGGSANDPGHRAQNPNALLGKMLRIDVNVPDADSEGYRVPPDNPFLDGQPIAALPEIWAFGMRNPWRYSFDDPTLGGTGALIIADVGQNAWEEIDYEPRGAGGRNYGWRNREGARPNPNVNATLLPPAYFPLTDPIHEYDHDRGVSITGGFVYRGSALGATFRGRYFYADFTQRKIWSIGLNVNATTGEATATNEIEHTADLGGSDALGFISSFGVDPRGELYVVGYSQGIVFRLLLDAQPPPTATSVTPATSPVAGGVRLTVTGSNFVFGATVLIGGVAGIDPVVTSATTLQVTAPAHAAGPVDIIVTNPGGQSVTLSGALLYTTVVNDADGDGLPDAFETQFGLDPASAAGVNGAGGDPDGDGVTNLAEFQAGTHPRGFFTRYFAEGANSTFFDTIFALLNPDASVEAKTLLRFQKPDLTTASLYQVVPALGRRTVASKSVTGIADSAFATIIESDVLLVADRTMSWDASEYGGHAETSIAAPATTWYLAEGATHSGFDLFYLIQNPSAAAVNVEVTYLLAPGVAPVVKTYSVDAGSRFNIWVNNESLSLPALANANLSAVLRAPTPIIVERAMYRGAAGQPFGAGHASAGITTPSTSWFFAEGATGSYFDLFLLLANPNAPAAQVDVRYQLPSGTVIPRSYTVAGNSRFNIFVDQEGAALADTAVSMLVSVTNGVAIVAERAMWWPGPTAATWFEAHNAAGVTATGPRWAVAGGEVGGVRLRQTYVLIANTSAFGDSVRVRLAFEDGTSAERTVQVAGTSRFNVDVSAMFAEAANKRFGVIVESLGATPAQLAVECAVYWNAAGQVWAAGTALTATRLP